MPVFLYEAIAPPGPLGPPHFFLLLVAEDCHDQGLLYTLHGWLSILCHSSLGSSKTPWAYHSPPPAAQVRTTWD